MSSADCPWSEFVQARPRRQIIINESRAFPGEVMTASTSKTTLGKLPREAIRRLELPHLPEDILEGFRALVDLTGTLSDAMDELGIVGVVPAFVLPPMTVGTRVIGPALTVRNVAHTMQIYRAALDKVRGRGDSEAHNLAEAGDVLVIEGVMGCSNMGGQSATIARRQGFAGAIVDGTVRDPDQFRSMGWPVWCRGLTPITGKWRMQTVEVNGTVQIRGVQVRPGDLVCADEAGVAFVPFDKAASILDVARTIDAGDTKRKADIDAGVRVSELIAKKYK
jgi:4-hydroxy-4-methyl-2-oxoglutarate aldolase